MSKPSTDEHIEAGADVVGSDGEKLGTVAYVVVHPEHLHITNLVVSTGQLLGRDVVVGADTVVRVADGQVNLSIDQHKLATCPDYVDIHYRQPPASWAPPAGYFYPMDATLWSADPYYPGDVQGDADVTVNAPSGTVGLHEGMHVESSDGHKVGTIRAFDADSSTGDIGSLVVEEGLLFKKDVNIPADEIDRIEEDRVFLKVTKDDLKSRDRDDG